MNTPAHVVLNLLVLASPRRPRLTAAIVTGALLPDAPMFVFYLWQKWAGAPERLIWGARYFEPAWQAFFDLTNSLPLIVTRKNNPPNAMNAPANTPSTDSLAIGMLALATPAFSATRAMRSGR